MNGQGNGLRTDRLGRVPVWLLLALACVPLFFLNIHNAHQWGDDWTQYIQEARNIATGKPFYQSLYRFSTLNPQYAPPQYPPGYPVLAAPVVGRWGAAVAPLLYLNAVLFSLLLFALYAGFRQRCSTVVAFCLAVIGVYNPSMLDLKSQALSDVPCLVFLAAYFALRLRRSGPLRGGGMIALVALSTYAILVRTQALLLPAAEGLVWAGAAWSAVRSRKRLPDLVRHPSLPLAVLPLLVFGLLEATVLKAPSSGLAFYGTVFGSGPRSLWACIGNNALILQSASREFFKTFTHDAVLGGLVEAVTTVCVASIGIGWLRALRSGPLAVDDVFFLLMILLLLVLPVSAGSRYLIPVLPLLLRYAKAGLGLLPAAFRVAPRTLAVLFTAVFLGLSYDGFEASLRTPPGWTANTPADSVAFAAVRRIVPPTDLVLFSKPRLLALYTGRPSMNLAWDHSVADNRRYNDSLGGPHWLLWHEQVSERIFKDYVAAQPHDSVILHPGCILYRLR